MSKIGKVIRNILILILGAGILERLVKRQRKDSGDE